MARYPLPSVPSRLIDIEVADTPRRGAPVASLVAGNAGDVREGEGAFRWLVGVGEGTASDLRTAGAALARAAQAENGKPVKIAQVDLGAETEGSIVAELSMGALLGGYHFKVSTQPAPALQTLRLLTPYERAVPEYEMVLGRVRTMAAAAALARDLANAPSNIKNPQWLGETAERVVTDVPGLRATIRDEAWLAEQNFGGVLAVGGGSASPPRLIELTYRPRGAAHHLLLVGKGITFDTGGLSIKPADGMHLMRTDMAGGAAVIAAIRAIATLGLDVRVTALVPAAENHVSGGSYRPGDVVRHYGGMTTEVSNTDAEGRMVLADALVYGIRRFRPDAVVDAATLTGAMKVALGLRTGGLFATDDELADRVLAAGERAGEAWWRMPLLEAHADAVRGELADVRQAPGGPGGVTAALFLREFTRGVPWAHLDIAGPARAETAYAEVVPGATGFAARTLVELAASYA
ncbi:leucyl aminopeptidase family protein [Amycolatopsis alkalitolerans]|uniref:Probable cytosol aminopeptidase n=1 Tax=Amycolatopsis alkalitolerans TaxID=2547244 RepID=A0A5C4LR72_9PSEU|nr:M17 family metallopeptidase [Amycolatopsis alkalitolerans]TNC20800.1 peptidase M17 [Amycolatopsis alkalitolerans]